MADTKISALTAVTGLTGVEQVPVNQSGTTKRYTIGIPKQAAPANPAAGATNTELMMGLGASANYTPTSTGRILVLISGDGANNTLNDGCILKGRYGTGTAPVNGAAISGTVFTRAGGHVYGGLGAPASTAFPWIVHAVITGLTLATAYWFDVSLIQLTGGTVTIENVDFSVTEI
jgi:hypothetical protein